ncbi:hypothetical protein M426DRAFT_25094 [Hypoxylon sp. CI-4A]|nr:hypothetical protein M426DRAFT_25094 [Hypoxylon sp. CI-4A]
MSLSPSSPDLEVFGKRKADAMSSIDEVEGEITDNDAAEEPRPKKAKTEDAKVTHTHAQNIPKRWNLDMEIPQGRPRPKFLGESEEARRSGSGTVEDPLIVWLGKPPADAAIKQANESLARRSVEELQTITHIYIRCGAQSSMFVDRDGKRIPIWNPDVIRFVHETAPTNPHMSLAFGTNADSLVLYGYVNVSVDDDGVPSGFSEPDRDGDGVDGDGRILEFFVYEEEEKHCKPYCTCKEHGEGQVLINTCEFAKAAPCNIHHVHGLLDHWCVIPVAVRYRHCRHELNSLMDHYCPHPIPQNRDRPMRIEKPRRRRYGGPPRHGPGRIQGLGRRAGFGAVLR